MKTIKELVNYIKNVKLSETQESILRSKLLCNMTIELDDDYFMNREKRRVNNK